MDTPVFDLCDEYVRRWVVLDPVGAGVRGVVGDFGPATDYGPDGLAARADLIRDTLRRLAALAPTGPADEHAAGFLAERLGAELASIDLDEPLRQVRSPFGLVDSLRDAPSLLPQATPADWVALADRLAALPGMLVGWQDTLRLGLSRGLTAARRQVLATAGQAQRYADDGTHDELVARYGDGPLAGRLADAARAAHGGYAQIARFLREEYLPHATERDAVGAQRYAVASRLFLGDDIDPVDAYHWGWDELRRIEVELAAEAERVQPGASVAQAVALLDRTEVVHGADAYLDWLRERHAEAIEALDGVHFDLHPALRTVDVVLAVGSGSGAAYYTPPSEDLTRPGRTWWPLGGRAEFAVWGELTTVFHEGVPGHHLQLGATRTQGAGLSRFSRLTGVSGHSEGWALYAERLADELGWFTPPGSRLGMLKGSALRAARVVIDIGVHLELPLPAPEAARHGPQWTFEVAGEVLRTRGGAAEHRVHAEVLRYFGWPAQAISYKLGERAWLAARDRARQRAGAAFDLKAWHTATLALGSVGLAGLSAALDQAGTQPG